MAMPQQRIGGTINGRDMSSPGDAWSSGTAACRYHGCLLLSLSVLRL